MAQCGYDSTQSWYNFDLSLLPILETYLT